MPKQHSGPRPLAERVWERIEQRGPDECWPTNGEHSAKGYARFVLDGRHTTVHRAVFFLLHQSSPQVVRHTCDQPWCANPAHLQGGTYTDNHRDMRERGRVVHALGERNGQAKLTAEIVRLIRSSPERNAVLARRYGVAPSLISVVRRGKVWKHV